MKKAVVFYQSKTGTTKNYAQEISAYLETRQLETLCLPVNEYQEYLIQDTDYLFLGCWTKGLMVILQKPDEIWNAFADSLPVPINTKVALFATYKIGTGSIFRNMGKHLKQYTPLKSPNLKSRNGKLSEADKVRINEFLNS